MCIHVYITLHIYNTFVMYLFQKHVPGVFTHTYTHIQREGGREGGREGERERERERGPWIFGSSSHYTYDIECFI